MLSTLLSVPAWRAAVPAQRSLVRRRGACAMAATARTAFSAADFPAEWPYAAEDFSRLDEQPDIQFYSAPRFVTHIDDGAIATLKQYYDEQLPEGADVLDICSSWISHLPPDKPLGRVVGVGMNARELEANERLTEFVQEKKKKKKNPTLTPTLTLALALALALALPLTLARCTS